SNARVTYRASRLLRTIPHSPVGLCEILLHLCDKVPLNRNDANQDDPAKATAEIERGSRGSRIQATGTVLFVMGQGALGTVTIHCNTLARRRRFGDGGLTLQNGSVIQAFVVVGK